ncbi:MAG: phosphatidylinositol mannoside acyltransferase [Actinomycetota bacterium]|jgi:KDO2-lipid IV(A) lauroyltransferase|nr:phosphatidylinositol mannoside acyltransferase [Euzebyaceae bacterium]MDQ3453303.1 phosphatidylinositol mannoside acyltransferase [Actinomycetota bacterium]
MTAYRGSGHPGAVVDRNPGAAGRLPEDSRPESARLRRIAIAWTALWEVARRLPEPVAYAGADLAGRVQHRLAHAARARVRANFARVVAAESLDATVKAAFRSYARYWVEAFRAADIDPADIDWRTTTAGFEHLDAALERGRGVVVLLAHHGSWDSAARWAETHGYHLAVVAEVLRPRSTFKRFVALREEIGLEVVPLAKGAQLTGRLTEVAAANHLVGLLTDRDLTGRAPVTDFFGEPARIPVGAAVLSRRTGAPIVPITMVQRPGRRWHLQVHPVVEVADVSLAAAAGRIAKALEALIQLEPAQWHAFQPVWEPGLAARRRGGQDQGEPTTGQQP